MCFREHALKPIQMRPLSTYYGIRFNLLSGSYFGKVYGTKYDVQPTPWVQWKKHVTCSFGSDHRVIASSFLLCNFLSISDMCKNGCFLPFLSMNMEMGRSNVWNCQDISKSEATKILTKSLMVIVKFCEQTFDKGTHLKICGLGGLAGHILYGCFQK